MCISSNCSKTRAIVKALMPPFVNIQIEVVAQASKQRRYDGLRFDVDVLIRYDEPALDNLPMCLTTELKRIILSSKDGMNQIVCDTLTISPKSDLGARTVFEARLARTGAVDEMFDDQIGSLTGQQLRQGQGGPQQSADIG